MQAIIGNIQMEKLNKILEKGKFLINIRKNYLK